MGLSTLTDTLAEQAVSALEALLSPFLQGSRLIQLHFAEEAGTDESLAALGAPALVVERFTGAEAVNAPFAFELDCLSPSTQLALDAFLGSRVRLAVTTASGAARSWNGLITHMASTGSDGGLARYRISLRPFTEYLALRRDARIFQEQTTQQILSAVLEAHAQTRAQAQFRFEVGSAGRLRPLCCQYQESDWAFLTRLMAEEGWNYRFEHSDADHVLVIFDAEASLALPAGAQPSIRFAQAVPGETLFMSQPPAPPSLAGRSAGLSPLDSGYSPASPTERSDTITALSLVNSVQPTTVTAAGWDWKTLLSPASSSSAEAAFANVPALEWFAGNATGSLGRFDAAVAASASSQQQRAFDAAARRLEGSSSVRALSPGTRIAVTAYNESRSLVSAPLGLSVLAVEHEAANNLGAGIAGPLGASDLERGTYRNRFVALSERIAIAPVWQPKPSAPGLQTALVVGLGNAPITSHRDHSVKVQFPWQRGVSPNAGGLFGGGEGEHPSLAPGDETTGIWVRVAESLAGPDWGSVFVPRIGSEVLVDFMEGDLDCPVIVGSLYNGADAPPFSAGVGSGANHPGVLSGWHQPTLSGDGYNQWLLDDATGQLRTRLLSSAGQSSLTLGYLIEQRASVAGGSQRGAYRGEGVELSTQAWGVVRAGEGLLLSASAAASSPGSWSDSPTGNSLALGEASGQLKAAAELADALAQAASSQGATASTTAAAFKQLAEQLAKPEQEATKALASRSHQDSQGRPIPEAIAAARFEKPFLIAETPESLVLSTPASAISMASGHLHQLAQGDAQLTALSTFSQVSGQGASLYTHSGGAQLIAAGGPLSIQSHADTLSLLADQNVQITSSSDSITVQAKGKIVLAAGQSSITLDGSNITFACPGTFSVKGAMQEWPAGKSNKASFKSLPSHKIDLYAKKFRLTDKDSKKPLIEMSYFIRTKGGLVFYGKTDDEGYTDVANSNEKEMVEIYYGHAALVKIHEVEKK